jgi:ferredoxin
MESLASTPRRPLTAASFLLAVPPLLSLALLSAHNLRFGRPGLVLFWASLAGLYLTRQGWARKVLMLSLAAGCLVWAQAGTELVSFRLAMGSDWLRLAMIMGAVFFTTFFSIVMLGSRSARGWFNKGEKEAGPAAASFVLSTAALGLLNQLHGLKPLLLERYLPGYGWMEVLILALYAATVTRAMLDVNAAPRTRSRIWSLFSLLFFAQLIFGLLGAERMLMTGTLHLPVPALILAGPLYRGEGFLMLAIFLGSIALAGPAWCSHLCYIGAWDDCLSRNAGTIRPLPSWAPGLRWAILILSLAVALSLRILEVPVGVALTIAVIFGMAGLLIMAFASARTGTMVHCTLYCPVGLAAKLLGRLSPWRIRMGAGCTSCGRCTTACRYNALTPKDIESGRPGLSCSLCGDCVSACPHKVLSYRFPGLSAVRARTAFIVLIVTLHALFLGVARI